MDKELIHKLRQDQQINIRLCGHDLRFKTTWGLFSPREIDEGTELLLQYLDIKETDHCLDLGCGYGPIGITMAKAAPQGDTLLLDKDFVAVDYANRNIGLNGLSNASAQLSNAFDQTPAQETYDVIASNIPAKVGKELLSLMLWDAQVRLKPGGALYVVTINGLRQFMKRYMDDVFGDYKKLKQGKTYTVARAIKSAS